MDRVRILKTVEAEWGKSVVYEPKPEPEEKKEKHAKKKSTASRYSVVQDHSVKEIRSDAEQALSMTVTAPDRSSASRHSTVQDHSMTETRSAAEQTLSMTVTGPDRSVTKQDTVSTDSDEDEDEYKFWCLEYFPASMFATILEDTITEYRILVQCNTEMRITKMKADMILLRAIKYGVEQPPVTDELDGIDPHNLGCIEYKLNKLEADRNYLNEVLTCTYIDLTLKKNFKCLLEKVNAVKEYERYCAFIIEEEARNRAKYRELCRQLRLQRNYQKTAIYEADAIIDNLNSEVEDATIMTETRSRYVDNWQRGRTEQHQQTIDNKQDIFLHSIEYFKERSDHEQRVHSEVDLLTTIVINETLQKVEEWMDKYEKDMEKIDLKIQIKKNDYQNMLEKRIDLERTIEKHDKLMKEWIKFKDDREKARQYEIKMNKSAIIVQAWWRGLLVRRQLGPFKPPRKKKGGKKK